MRIRKVLPVLCLLLICPGVGVAGDSLSARCSSHSFVEI